MSTVWPFVPQRRLKESIEWKTEIMRCRSAEQRLCLRNIPRTTIEYDFQLLPQEVDAATVLARQYGADEFLLPFWHELEYVGTVASSATNITVDTTTKRYKAGGTGFIIGSDGKYETFIIDTVNPGSIDIAAPGIVLGFAGAVVMPAHPARVKKPFSFRKFAGEYFTAEMEYILDEDYELTGINPYTSFNSSYVLSDRPLALNARESHTREFTGFGNLSGPMFYSKNYTYPISTSMMSWSFNTVAEVWAFRLWSYTIKGKQESFYVPRWTRDFILNSDALSTDDFLILNRNNTLEDTYTGAICIVKNDGSQLYYLVDSWQSDTASTYRMNLTTTLGEDVTASDVELICRMPKMRFNSDNIELDYLDAKVVNVRLPVIEVPE
jgi:hypothetical protein